MKIEFILPLIASVFLGSQAVESQVSFRLCPSSMVWETDPLLVTHPLNSRIMLGTASVPQAPYGSSPRKYTTTNAGTTWLCNTDTILLPPWLPYYGAPRPVIDKNGMFIIVCFTAGATSSGLEAIRTSNNGVTWLSSTVSTSSYAVGHRVGTDDMQSSPYYGRTYCVWSDLALSIYRVVFSFTSDGGASWSPNTTLNAPPAGHYSYGADVVVGPDGIVYVTWAALTRFSPGNEDFYGFAKSANGGETWQVTEDAFDGNGIRGVLPEKQNIRVNSSPRIAVDKTGGPRNGWVYIVTAEKNVAPAGSDPDILLHWSTDGGAAWTHMRVNQDSVNNGKIQYFPAIAVDSAGGVNVVYYDDRTTTSDSSSVFLSRSTNGGNTWQDNEVADHHFRPEPISGTTTGYQGDFIGIAAAGGKVWPIWVDNSSGLYQTWITVVSICPVAVANERLLPKVFSLQQNYPNPFNPSTTLRFELPQKASVRVEVFDLLGRQVRKLVDSGFQPGSHEIVWDGMNNRGAGVASGVYICRLVSGGRVETRRMMLTR